MVPFEEKPALAIWMAQVDHSVSVYKHHQTSSIECLRKVGTTETKVPGSYLPRIEKHS